MKIESLYIAGFGKFKDYSLIFNDGFNIFYGENENGKTTLLTFIKMMFYGSSAKGNDILKNPRKKYIPWDGSPMAGNIDFSHGGKLYRLERTFGASNTSDKVVLTELDTGKRETYSGTTEIGAAFFGLSASAFERSVFIGQINLGENGNDTSGELNQKLSSLVLSGDEETSETVVASRLISAKEAVMSKSGKKGKYDLNRLKLAELNEELQKSRKKEEEREILANKIENQKKRLVLVSKEIDRIKAALKSTENSRNRQKLKDYINTSEEISSFENKLKKKDGNIISPLELTETETAIAKYKLLKQELPDSEKRLTLLNSEILQLSKEAEASQPVKILKENIKAETEKSELLKAEISEIKSKIENAETVRALAKSEKPKINPIFLIFSILGAVIALSSLIFSKYSVLALSVGITVTAVFSVLTLAFKKKTTVFGKKELSALESLQAKLEELQLQSAEVQNIITEKQDLLSSIEAEDNQKDILKSEKLELKEKTEKNIENIKEELSRLEAFFKEIFPKENMTASVSGMEIVLHAYKDYSRKIETAKTKIAILKADLGNLSKQDAEIKLSGMRQITSEEDPKSSEEFLAYKQKEASEIQKSIAYDEAVAKTDFKAHRHPTEVEHEIQSTLEKTVLQKQFCESIDIALNALNAAFAQTRKSFGTVLEKRTGEIFKQITSEKYKDLTLSKDFDITAQPGEAFGSKEWQYLSSGTADQAYFALRLAVSEILSNDCNGLPILLDDSFAQYDDERIKKALDFLAQYSKNNQVIYFTCHKSGLDKYENVNKLI